MWQDSSSIVLKNVSEEASKQKESLKAEIVHWFSGVHWSLFALNWCYTNWTCRQAFHCESSWRWLIGCALQPLCLTRLQIGVDQQAEHVGETYVLSGWPHVKHRTKHRCISWVAWTTGENCNAGGCSGFCGPKCGRCVDLTGRLQTTTLSPLLEPSDLCKLWKSRLLYLFLSSCFRECWLQADGFHSRCCVRWIHSNSAEEPEIVLRILDSAWKYISSEIDSRLSRSLFRTYEPFSRSYFTCPEARQGGFCTCLVRPLQMQNSLVSSFAVLLYLVCTSKEPHGTTLSSVKTMDCSGAKLDQILTFSGRQQG